MLFTAQLDPIIPASIQYHINDTVSKDALNSTSVASAKCRLQSAAVGLGVFVRKAMAALTA
jgi:hypothetical protein